MLRSRLRAFLTYIAWETIAIHALTGLLFAAISFLLVANVGMEAPWALVFVVPLLTISWMGWLAQARAAITVARAIRDRTRGTLS